MKTELTLSQAFDIAEAALLKKTGPQGRPCGTFINDKGEVVPITAPRPESEPKKKLRPVSIDALIDAEGSVDDAESHDPEVVELGLMTPKPVAGEEISEEADVEVDLG